MLAAVCWNGRSRAKCACNVRVDRFADKTGSKNGNSDKHYSDMCLPLECFSEILMRHVKNKSAIVIESKSAGIHRNPVTRDEEQDALSRARNLIA